MQSQDRSPRWWLIYLLILVALGLFWLEAHAALTSAEHEVAEALILLVVFTLVAAWLHFERLALMRQTMDGSRGSGAYTYRLVEFDQSLWVDPERSGKK